MEGCLHIMKENIGEMFVADVVGSSCFCNIEDIEAGLSQVPKAGWQKIRLVLDWKRRDIMGRSVDRYMVL